MALKMKFDHTIRCAAQPENGTCVTHAFDLLSQSQRLVEALQDLSVKPGKCFIEWLLIGTRIDETERPEAGSLAFYFSESEWRHAAVMMKECRFQSKWGSYAIFDHRISEVPENYGNVVRFFKRPDPSDAAKLFFDFGCLQLGLAPLEIENLRGTVGMQ
jgi:hypothetical protein